MAGYTFRSISAFVNGTGVLSPSMPAGWAAGDLMLYFTGNRGGSETLSTPAGWTLLSPEVNATQIKLFGRIAVGGDTAPSVDWSASNTGFATIAAFYGDVYPDLSTIVHVSADRASSSVNVVTIPALTPTINGCLIIAGGRRIKTATADGDAFVSIPGSHTQIGENIPNGSSNHAGLFYWQQTTATSMALDAATGGITDTSGNTIGFRIALKAQAPAGGLLLTESGLTLNSGLNALKAA